LSCALFEERIGTCSDEMKDLNLLNSMQRLFSLTMEKKFFHLCCYDDVTLTIVDMVMATAIDFLQLGHGLSRNNNVVKMT
jgi:hypothetical protein